MEIRNSIFVAVAAFVSINSVAAQWQRKVLCDSRTLPEIYAAAQKEHKTTAEAPLQVLMGGDAGSQGDAYRQAWRELFPDLPLNLTIDLSKYQSINIDLAYYGNRHIADVVGLQTVQDFGRWKAENRLLYYKPTNYDDIINGEKDLDGAYVHNSVFPFGIFFFDKTKVTAEEIPDSYESLIDSKWKGRLILTYPNDDDAVGYLFTVIVSRYGVSWLHALAANDVKWVRGAQAPYFELKALHNTTSKRAVTLSAVGPAEWLGKKEVKAPEQRITVAPNMAIMASTPRPEAAKLFVSLITSKEYLMNTTDSTTPTPSYSLNKERGLDAYQNNITQLSNFRLYEWNRASVEWWRNLYEDILGTPQGANPMVMYPNPPYKP